jgi:hypothetical protein
MPKKINVRAILLGKLQGMSNNDIASTYHGSKHSVADVVIIATEKEILPLGPIPNLSEEELYQLFFPDRNTQEAVFEPVDYEYVHKELNRVGVTLSRLWTEYKADTPSGKSPVSYSKFTKGYTAYVGNKGFANHIVHKAGDRIEVDWSGPRMHYLDLKTGKSVTVYLFVSDLVSSRLAYVEPTLDMQDRHGYSAISICGIITEEFQGSWSVTTFLQESRHIRNSGRLCSPRSMSCSWNITERRSYLVPSKLQAEELHRKQRV